MNEESEIEIRQVSLRSVAQPPLLLGSPFSASEKLSVRYVPNVDLRRLSVFIPKIQD